MTIGIGIRIDSGGGAASEFVPAIFESARIRFRADMGHSAPLLGSVSSWANQAETALVPSIDAVTNSPLLERTRGAHGLFFRGAPVDRLRATTFSSAMVSPNTVLLVCQLMQTGGTAIFLDGGSGTTRHDFFTAGAGWPRDLSYNAGSTRTAAGVITKNHQICAILAVFGAAGFKLYVNGTDITPALGPGSQNWDGINLGTSNTGANATRFVACELVGWDTVLTAQDIADVFAYCDARYKYSQAARNFLALGDSITVGQGSPDGGWRKVLRDTTRSAKIAGYWLGSVGPTADTRWADDIHGGQSGNTIAQITARVTGGTNAMGHLPDVVVAIAGTNDCRNNGTTYNPVTTPAAYQTLIETIHNASPGIPIVVTTIPPLAQAAHDANVLDFNDELTRAGGVWDTLEGAGKNLVRINLHQDAFGGAYNAAQFDVDGVHPNNTGYAAMEAVIRSGLATALAMT